MPTRILLALALAAACAPASARAAEFWLRAAPFVKTMPDGRAVPMWGFGLYDPAAPASAAPPSSPGPALTVPAGDGRLVVHLRNELPVPISFHVPGQPTDAAPTFVDGAAVHAGARPPGNVTARVRSFAHETAPGATATYAFDGVAPGTWLYQSGTHPAVQVQMGLHGALTVIAAGGTAYPGIAAASEVTVHLAEVDPALHDAVAAGAYGPGRAITSPVGYAPRYFLLNGDPWAPGRADLAAGAAGQPVLVRLLNAGNESRVPMWLGLHARVVAEGGRPVALPTSRYAPLLAPGTTLDLLVTFPAPGRYPLLDRRLPAQAGPLTFVEAR